MAYKLSLHCTHNGKYSNWWLKYVAILLTSWILIFNKLTSCTSWPVALKCSWTTDRPQKQALANSDLSVLIVVLWRLARLLMELLIDHENHSSPLCAYCMWWVWWLDKSYHNYVCIVNRKCTSFMIINVLKSFLFLHFLVFRQPIAS